MHIRTYNLRTCQAKFFYLDTLNKNLFRLAFQVLILSHEDKSNLKMYINQHGRTGRKKLGGRNEICPTFSDYARPVPKIFFPKQFRNPPPPPTTSPKKFGQSTILGVQNFFGHTKIFRNIIQISQTSQNWPQNWQNFPQNWQN